MSRAHVLIAGGGIGGLTAALALLKRGFDVDVYEQAAELKEIGAGLQLSANGNRALYALGVGDELKRLACEATGKEVRLWNSGQTWKLFDLGAVSVARYGFPYFTVYRPDLLEILARAVRREKADAIHLGARCTGCTQDGNRVILHFEGGEAAGDALVGADGVHSRIRQALFGADAPEFTGLVAWRGTIPMSRLPDHMRRLVGTNWIGPGAHVVHYPVHGGEYMNFVGIVERGDWRVESWTAQGTAAECAADFRGWHPDVHAMIRNIDAPFKWALMGRPPMPRVDGRPRDAPRRRLPSDPADARPGRGDGDRGRVHPRARARGARRRRRPRSRATRARAASGRAGWWRARPTTRSGSTIRRSPTPPARRTTSTGNGTRRG